MTLSYSEDKVLTCPTCGAEVQTTVWVLLDSQEQPVPMEALRQGKLNMSTCSQCGASFAAGTALLLHDRSSRRLFFAMPQGKPEHVWREQARAMHEQLLKRLPAEERDAPYLSDIQIAQDVSGIAHLLNKHDTTQRRSTRNVSSGGQVMTGDGRVWSGAPATTTDTPRAAAAPTNTASHHHDNRAAGEGDSRATVWREPVDQTTPTTYPAEQETLHFIQQCALVESLDELRVHLAQYPVSQIAATIRTLAYLADNAFEERAYELANNFSQLRHLIHQIATTGEPHFTTELSNTRSSMQYDHTKDNDADTTGARASTCDDTFDHDQDSDDAKYAEHADEIHYDDAEYADDHYEYHDHDDDEEPLASLPQEAYFALLTTTATDDVRQVVQDYPVVLEPWFDAALDDVCDQVVREGDVRMAHLLEHRREIIFMLRQEQEIGME